MNFWEKLKEENKGPARLASGEAVAGGPIICLAPLADVTDSAFRHVIAKNGKPDVLWTEFVSADGLILAGEVGKKKLMKDLEYSEIERPIVAQLFGSRPENMRKASSLVLELGFDGLDINMGCPDKSVEKQGSGAALIKTPKLAREIIKAAKEGIKEAAERLGKQEIPVSIKTRLGYNADTLEEWLPELLAESPALITVHARTRKEMSKVPARWERVKRAVEIRDELKSKTLIFGNGDVVDVEDARIKAKESDADGVMLGRAIFGNPFLFRTSYVPTKQEKLQALKDHIELFNKNLGEVKSFAVMRKHFKSYLSGLEITKELKDRLMTAENAEKAISVLEKMF